MPSSNGSDSGSVRGQGRDWQLYTRSSDSKESPTADVSGLPAARAARRWARTRRGSEDHSASLCNSLIQTPSHYALLAIQLQSSFFCLVYSVEIPNLGSIYLMGHVYKFLTSTSAALR